jgi:hypothetical protein
MERMIRLDNRFVYKRGSKYYITDVTNVSEWLQMSDKEKKQLKCKNVTTKVKRLLNEYDISGNINIKTKPSMKKIKHKTKKKSKKKKGGG